MFLDDAEDVDPRKRQMLAREEEFGGGILGVWAGLVEVFLEGLGGLGANGDDSFA